MVVKPIGSHCNLDCIYCYYLHKEAVLSDAPPDRISVELLDELIKQAIAGQDLNLVSFTWHGGEPTLLGLDFFQNVVRIQQKYAGGKRIENNFQTNGVLLDESWCKFLKDNDFYVGLSIDGPKHLHDLFRMCKGGDSSFDQVYRAAQLLQQFDVPLSALTVIHSENARHPEEVYQFLTKDLGCKRIQWLPCVEPKDFRTVAPGQWDIAWMPVLGSEAARPGYPNSVVTDWSVDPDDWGNFLIKTFALWLKNDAGKVSVHWYDSLINQWMGQPATICSLAGVCGRSLVTIEKDGSVYSCDHFVFPEYKLGNILDKDQTLVDMVYSQKQRDFGCKKHTGLPDYCKQCKYLLACHGECPKNRFLKTPSGQPGLNYLCSGNRRFFTYADPYIRQLINRLNDANIAYAMT